jgi:hypothetical protein
VKYAAEMESVAMIYILSFIKTGSGIETLGVGVVGYSDTDRVEIEQAYFRKVG